ncbi:MAG: amidophosphoribosyltransferase [Planctomycetaceae bacterium]|nr:amidophosphoribosyltransferase [Planctomycetaceae bacterium]
MAELHEECGIAAVYHLPDRGVSPLAPEQGPHASSRLIPRMLLEIQNRGQLAAGITSFNSTRNQLIDTHKNVGTVTEVFSLNHRRRFEKLMQRYSGPAAIGHVRYATCGKDDKSYAQPFERHHIEKSKWFSFAFNGQLANYQELKQDLLSQSNFHLARETDTEILMHMMSRELKGGRASDLLEVFSAISEQLDGAYNVVFLNALGDMFVARDPLGIKPLCIAREGAMFAAASESVALSKLGFKEESIRSLAPGSAVIIQNGEYQEKQYTAKSDRAHCFFEWIYFANVASTLDERSVYITRKRLGEELAQQEPLVLNDDTIVVPVPDTAKAAADSMAFQLNVPCLEGLIRNRYVGRTFIEGSDRAQKVRTKFTVLPEVLEGKRVLLVEDTIVRSTTMQELIQQIRDRGRAKEVHVRVACPPIIAPCFYGIDMSTVSELFAPKFMNSTTINPEIEKQMANTLGADSLCYLPLDAIARSVGIESKGLCQACIDGTYPTLHGQQLYNLALFNNDSDDKNSSARTYDAAAIPIGTRT